MRAGRISTRAAGSRLEDLDRALAAVGDSLAAHERILEFGCGCGRIMRWMEHLAPGRSLVGTDIDARAIEWAPGEHPLRELRGERRAASDPLRRRRVRPDRQPQRVHASRRAPPGPLAGGAAAHHGARRQARAHRSRRPWLRVAEQQLEPGSRERLRWREVLERDGHLYIAEDSFVGSSFPDFYHTTFHAPWYVLEHWAGWFDVLAYLPRSSLGFQDQVVLRRPVESEQATRPIRARVADGGAAAPRAGDGEQGTGVATPFVDGVFSRCPRLESLRSARPDGTARDLPCCAPGAACPARGRSRAGTGSRRAARARSGAHASSRRGRAAQAVRTDRAPGRGAAGPAPVGGRP